MRRPVVSTASKVTRFGRSRSTEQADGLATGFHWSPSRKRRRHDLGGRQLPVVPPVDFGCRQPFGRREIVLHPLDRAAMVHQVNAGMLASPEFLGITPSLRPSKLSVGHLCDAEAVAP